jgi:hypothetical protein
MIPRQSLLVRARGGGPVSRQRWRGIKRAANAPRASFAERQRSRSLQVQLLLLLLTGRVGPHLPLLPDGS